MTCVSPCRLPATAGLLLAAAAGRRMRPSVVYSRSGGGEAGAAAVAVRDGAGAGVGAAAAAGRACACLRVGGGGGGGGAGASWTDTKRTCKGVSSAAAGGTSEVCRLRCAISANTTCRSTTAPSSHQRGVSNAYQRRRQRRACSRRIVAVFHTAAPSPPASARGQSWSASSCGGAWAMIGSRWRTHRCSMAHRA